MIFCLEVMTGTYIEIQWYLGANDKSSSPLEWNFNLRTITYNSDMWWLHGFSSLTCIIWNSMGQKPFSYE
jgi:hypothetical protein